MEKPNFYSFAFSHGKSDVLFRIHGLADENSIGIAFRSESD
jgi:hypothetical protein